MSDNMARRYGATRYARASYSEVYDMHTEVGKTTLIGVHTPVTNRWQKFMYGFCKQFKQFRYKGASLSFVPVTTLPADPLQVSYEAGEPTIDPRDLMNPIIHCGMKGQSMGNYLDEIFRFNISDRLNSLDVVNVPDNTSAALLTDLEQAYYTALSSPQFRKSHVQTGFRKNGLHPRVYQLATSRPYNYYAQTYDGTSLNIGIPSTPSVATMGYPGRTAADAVFADSQDVGSPLYYQRDYANKDFLSSDPNYPGFDVGQFFTNKTTSLGWLDTLQRGTYKDNDDDAITRTFLTALPKVFMYFIMLPPAYKTEMYFRVVVNHYFEFRGFRTYEGPFSQVSSAIEIYDGMIQNDPVEQANVASMDIYNGSAELVSDGAM